MIRITPEQAYKKWPQKGQRIFLGKNGKANFRSIQESTELDRRR